MMLTAKSELLAESSVPLPLVQAHVSHELNWDRARSAGRQAVD